jgi:hypothetical protein
MQCLLNDLDDSTDANHHTLKDIETTIYEYFGRIKKQDIRIKHLWHNRYRVNVYGQRDEMTIIAQSYFLIFNDGVITYSNPPLCK